MYVYAEREEKHILSKFFYLKKIYFHFIFLFFSAGEDGNEENGQAGVVDDGFDGSDSASVASGTSDKEAVTMPTLEALEPESNG